ncbi:MAG: hypothetical protein HY920_07175 [Elusimicrobia bacterium]|nr:hypothetical protein [Elusimicrobiota bacterium]
MRKLIYWLANFAGLFVAICWLVFSTGQFVIGSYVNFWNYLSDLAGGLILTLTVMIAVRQPVVGGTWLFAEGFVFVMYCYCLGRLTAPNLLNGLIPMLLALLFLFSQRGHVDKRLLEIPKEQENSYKFSR